MSAKGLFITGIGTDVGKTVASAVITKALEAGYWKPAQCGDLDNSDSIKIARLTGLRTLPEAYRLQAPMSPHAAAGLEGVELSIDKIEFPKSDKTIVVEGAGGVMVPFSSNETYLDLMVKLNLPVVLVTRHYLGSINHTLLTIEALKARAIPIFGILFNGEKHPTTEAIIAKMSGVSILGRIDQEPYFDQNVVKQYAQDLKSKL